MLNENLKTLRKTKGLSQEELAIRLNVVRQTISKWEKGISVPDSDMLIKIADLFEVPVSTLLGTKLVEEDKNTVAEQLSRINEQLATRNRRSKLVVKIILGIILGFVILNIILVIIGVISFAAFDKSKDSSIVTEIEEIVPTP